MPFVEHQPRSRDRSSEPDRSSAGSLIAWIVLPFLFLFNMCPFLARILLGRYKTHVESDGWLAEWLTPRLVCGYCGARVQRLELNGEPFPIPPSWKDRGLPYAGTLATPVGGFWPYNREWRREHWEPSPFILQGELDSADQTRGWYTTEYREVDGGELDPKWRTGPHPGYPVFRKARTPADWCLLEPDDSRPRWVDPRRLEEALHVPDQADPS